MKVLFITLFVILFLYSCSKKIETPSNLSIYYYDSYDNHIHDVYISFFKGKKPLNHFFEFENKQNAIDICRKQEQKITEDKNYFRTHYGAASLFYSKKGGPEFREFNKINKLKFECHVKSDKPNKKCLADKFVEISKNEIGGDLSKLEELTDAQKDEFTKNVFASLKFWEATGTCNYDVLYESKVFLVEELK